MKPDIDKLLQKKMDRKDFLKHLGIGFAAITGVATVLKALTTMSSGGGTASKGYGASAYGGSRVEQNQKNS